MTEAATRPGALAIWVMAARPRTLTAAIVPVLVGTAAAAADQSFSPLPAAAALLGAILIQIGTNLANDYSDAKRGADAERIGPLRVTQAGLVSPGQMKRAIAIAFGLAALCGLYLVAVAGWPILAIGIASILSGLAYTGGPYPLGYHGLGDLFVFVFFGLLAVAGTYYVQALHWSGLTWVLAVPVGLLSVAILAVNNLRDLETDRRAGKRTLVARYGRRFGQLQFTAMLAGAFAVPVVLAASGTLRAWALAPLLALPLCLPLVRAVFSRPTPEGSLRALAGTSRLLLVYGLLLSIGILL